jgi:hypothetical protein
MNIYSDSKISDLVKVVGKETSENFSPTLRAKLVTINEHAGMCTMEVVESPYVSMVQGGSLNNDKVGMRYERPIAYVWNAYFF